jgi:hypothetical protein
LNRHVAAEALEKIYAPARTAYAVAAGDRLRIQAAAGKGEGMARWLLAQMQP